MTNEDYAGRFVRAPQPLRDEHSDKRRLVIQSWQRASDRRASRDLVVILVWVAAAFGLLTWAVERVVGQ